MGGKRSTPSPENVMGAKILFFRRREGTWGFNHGK